MARRRTDEEEVSLFPFLSILACLIGTLVLMIMGVALSQLDPSVVAVAEAYVKVRAELALNRGQIEQLTAVHAEQAAQGSAAQRRLAALQAEIERLERQAAQSPDARPLAAPPKADEGAHRRQMAQLEADLRSAQQRLKERQAELAARKLPPDPAPVVIRPGGSGVDLKPTFVECDAQGMVIYEAIDKPSRVGAGAIRTDARYLELLKRVAKDPKASLIFLVRSNGLGVYASASAVAKEHSARNGKLPVLGAGKIDLSFFQAKSAR